MATNTQTDAAVSGGLLVVLGIAVALGLGYAFYHYSGTDTTNIDVNLPAVESTPSAPSVPEPSTGQ